MPTTVFAWGGMDVCEALDEAAAIEQEVIDNFWAGS